MKSIGIGKALQRGRSRGEWRSACTYMCTCMHAPPHTRTHPPPTDVEGQAGWERSLGTVERGPAGYRLGSTSDSLAYWHVNSVHVTLKKLSLSVTSSLLFSCGCKK
jgi:hypothetical protein